MKLAELLSGIEIKEGCYDPELEVTGVSYDSRETKPGQAFVAIPGFASDGSLELPRNATGSYTLSFDIRKQDE